MQGHQARCHSNGVPRQLMKKTTSIELVKVIP